MKSPSQPLPWSVDETIDCDVVVLDADGTIVATFGEVRGEADFVVAVVNDWHRRNKKRGRK